MGSGNRHKNRSRCKGPPQYFTAHSTTWEPDTAVYHEDRPQHIIDTICPLEPVSWSSVPLALRIIFPDDTSHALTSPCGAGDFQTTKHSSLLLIEVLSVPRSRAVELSIASGATPVHTCRPSPGFYPSRLASTPVPAQYTAFLHLLGPAALHTPS